MATELADVQTKVEAEQQRSANINHNPFVSLAFQYFHFDVVLPLAGTNLMTGLHFEVQERFWGKVAGLARIRQPMKLLEVLLATLEHVFLVSHVRNLRPSTRHSPASIQRSSRLVMSQGRDLVGSALEEDE